MALIICENCGQSISDKAKVCPSCGIAIRTRITTIKCIDCGYEFTSDKTECPKCGCPVNEIENSQKVEVTGINFSSVNKKTVIAIVIAFIIIVVGIIAAITISNNIKDQKAAAEAARIAQEEAQRASDIKSSMELAAITMLSGATTAEDAGGLIHDVWYNTIYEKSDWETDKYTKNSYSFNDDFNTSLQKLFSDDDFQAKIDKIEENQEDVRGLMKGLSNVPDDCKEEYEALKELYDAYTEFTNLVVNPTGNLNSYTSAFNDGDSKVANCYEKMKLYMD